MVSAGPRDSEPGAVLAGRRVLLLGPVAPPIGGVSQYVRRLAAALSDAGATPTQVDLHRTSSADLGIERAPLQRVAKRLSGEVSYALRRAVRRERPALVVDSHDLFWRDAAHGASILKAAEAPYVLVIHDGAFPAFVGGLSATSAVRLKARLARTRGLVAVNEPIEAVLRASAPGVPVARLSPWLPDPAGASTANHATFFERHEAVICASGAASELYGMSDVCAAFEMLRARGHEIGLLLLLGTFVRETTSWEAIERVRTRRPDSVLVLEDDPAGPRLIAAAAVYIRATRVDGSPLAIEEARAAGVPVVATEHPTRPPGVIVFAPGDVAALAHAVEAALRPEAREKAAAAAAAVRLHAERNRAAILEFLARCLAPA